MARPATADVLEHLAGDLHSIAFDFREPARTMREVERRVGEVERICAEARASVRGGAATSFLLKAVAQPGILQAKG